MILNICKEHELQKMKKIGSNKYWDTLLLSIDDIKKRSKPVAVISQYW